MYYVSLYIYSVDVDLCLTLSDILKHNTNITVKPVLSHLFLFISRLQSFIQHRTRYTSRNTSFRNTGATQRVIPDTEYKNISSILEQAPGLQQPANPVYGRHGYEVRGDSAGSQRRNISGSSSAKLGEFIPFEIYYCICV